MSTYEFDIPQFRIDYPAFSDPLVYPDYVLQTNWDTATCYISNCKYGILNGDCRYKALTLMTAHLTALNDIIKDNPYATVPGLKQSATIDKITVSLTPPPLPNQYQWWLSLTPYGQNLLALLQAKSVGGFYVGGLPETAAFRRVGGIFR